MPLLKFREEILKICFLPFFINHVQYKLANNCVGLEKPMLQNYQILSYVIWALCSEFFGRRIFIRFPRTDIEKQHESSWAVSRCWCGYNWLFQWKLATLSNTFDQTVFVLIFESASESNVFVEVSKTKPRFLLHIGSFYSYLNGLLYLSKSSTF